ncbi:MAG: ribosome maturation factor RimP [Candidatus Acidiferrales bacterium]
MDLDRIRQMAEGVAGSEGLELVNLEWAGPVGRGVVRLIIDRPGGAVSHRDCEVMSRQLGTLLDVENLVEGRYVLEVASPGLDRKLYKPADYERFRGRRVKVRLKQPAPGLGRKFQGRLEGLADGVVSFAVDRQTVQVPYDDIDAVNLVVEL